MDEWLVMTRHRVLELPRFKSPKSQRVAIGAKLRRPFPEARIYQVTHADGWFYVYWISASLTAPRIDGEVIIDGSPD